MKFSYLVLTISLAAAPALAQEGQASADAAATPVININNSNANTASSTSAAQQTAVQETIQQPTTVVEASPVVESKAEVLRKARQNAEMQTEQKIVEKLEESRMQEEQKRAERLFGDRVENKAEATAVVVAPVVAAPVVMEVKEEKPTQVTIEKVEIIQPAAQQAPVQIVSEAPAAPAEQGSNRMYVGLGLGNSAYDANNVDSSYSLGVAVGMMMPNRFAVEGQFAYSNHNITDYWSMPIYHELDQYDIGVGAKWYILGGSIRPYVGGQISYIYRVYNERDAFCGSCSTNESETTQSVNVGPNVGLDVALSDSFSLGADFKYNMNFINKKEIDYSSYGVDDGTTPLEEIDYYTFQITGKMTF